MAAVMEGLWDPGEDTDVGQWVAAEVSQQQSDMVRLVILRYHQSCSLLQDQRWGHQLGGYEDRCSEESISIEAVAVDTWRGGPQQGEEDGGADRHQPQAWHLSDMETQGAAVPLPMLSFKPYADCFCHSNSRSHSAGLSQRAQIFISLFIYLFGKFSFGALEEYVLYIYSFSYPHFSG